jgi:hypothetical protein
LIQTPEYARAIVDLYRRENVDAAEAFLKARIRRQLVLEQENPPLVSVVLDESAIRRMVGGAEVMRQQLEYLVDLVERLKIELQLIPFSAGVHPGMLNGFTILEFDQPSPIIPEATIPGVVYVETLVGETYFDQLPEVEKHLTAFAEVRAAALPSSESRDLLRATRQEM